jgi:hypothetical protein
MQVRSAEMSIQLICANDTGDNVSLTGKLCVRVRGWDTV